MQQPLYRGQLAGWKATAQRAADGSFRAARFVRAHWRIVADTATVDGNAVRLTNLRAEGPHAYLTADRASLRDGKLETRSGRVFRDGWSIRARSVLVEPDADRLHLRHPGTNTHQATSRPNAPQE